MALQKKVLIIDNDMALCESFRKKFLNSINVSVVNSSEAGITKTAQWMPDLVILEIMIPGHQNGFDVLRQLKKSRGTKDIPVIIYTGLEGEREAAIEGGALDCLIKQRITPDSVAEKISRYLNLRAS